MASKKTDLGGTLRFKAAMGKLNAHLEELSNLVIEMINEAKEAFITDDEKLFIEIKNNLEKVHSLYYSLDDLITSTIALHHPFASDLRFILSTLKIANEIHRSAHDAVHIAHSTQFIELELHANIVKKIGTLVDKAAFMFKESIKMFRARKASDIKKWQELDDEVDNFHVTIIDEVVSLMKNDPSWTRVGVSLVLATRYIERIADHACNIVEESIYVVTSKRVKIE